MQIRFVFIILCLISYTQLNAEHCDDKYLHAHQAFNNANYAEALKLFMVSKDCYFKEADHVKASYAALYYLETLIEQKNYNQFDEDLLPINDFLKSLELSTYDQIGNEHSIILYQAKVSAGQGRMEKTKLILETLQTEFKNIIKDREKEVMTPDDVKWVGYAKRRLIYCYGAIANVFLNQKAYQTALDYYTKGLEFIKSHPEAKTAGNFNTYLVNMSKTYLELNEYESAKAKIHEAIAALNEVKETQKYKKQIYYQLVEVNKKEGKLDSAHYYLLYLIDQYGASDEDYGKTCFSLAEIALLQKKFDKAEQWIKCSIKNQKNNAANQLAEAHLLFAKIKHQQHLNKEAQTQINLALEKFGQNQNNGSEIYNITLAEILNFKIKLLLEEGQLDQLKIKESKKQINQALDILEKFRTNDLYQVERQDLVNFYYEFFETAIEVSYLDYQMEPNDEKLLEILQISEQGKAISLLESIHEMNAKKKAKVSSELLNKEIKLKNDLIDIEHQLLLHPSKHILIETRVAKKEELKLLLQDINSEFPEYEIFLNAFSHNNSKVAESLNAQKNKHDLIIEYFYSKHYIYSISMENGKLGILRIKNSAQIENKIIAFKESIIQKDKETYKKLGSEIFDLLLKPILKKQKDILIIPDGPLSLIPFEALLKNTAEEIYHYSDLPYLLNEHIISYSYSLILQTQLNTKELKNDRKLILGIHPDFKKYESIENLVFNEEEVNSIYNLLDQKEPSLKNMDKNEFLQLANEFRIIHLATHAKVDIENAANSNIIFNNDSLSLLYAKDIYTHSINPEMLVLSACQTGNGYIQKGEGVMSLSRAFLQAGTKSVVNSQWNLNDKSGKDIMLDFYKNLKAKQPKNIALQKAKLKYLSSPHNDALNAPAFWATYNLIGNVSPIYPKRSTLKIWILFILAIILFSLKKLT